MSRTAGSTCGWCRKEFTPRRDGGKPQVFCRPACRRAFDAAGRRWVADVIAAGMLTVDALRDGAATTRALLPGGNSLVRVSEPQKPAPVVPAERSDELLDDFLVALLDLPGWSDPESWLWNDVAAVLPDALFDRIDRYLEARLS